MGIARPLPELLLIVLRSQVDGINELRLKHRLYLVRSNTLHRLYNRLCNIAYVVYIISAFVKVFKNQISPIILETMVETIFLSINNFTNWSVFEIIFSFKFCFDPGQPIFGFLIRALFHFYLLEPINMNMNLSVSHNPHAPSL